jgi:uncharacterized protein (TIGR03083 family)
VDRTRYLDSLRADADLLLRTASGALGRPVPTCPGWTCERLVGHVGRVWRWTAAWVRGERGREVEQAPPGDAVVSWSRTGLDEVVGAIEAADPEAEVDTWVGRQPALFWPRRMAVEAALHRVDAQLAVGDPAPVDTALALDGIDEMLTVILPLRGAAELHGDGETIHLHATDDLPAGEGEWLVTLRAGGVAVERTHAKGDVAVRAPASELLLLLWNRADPERCEVFGDRGLLDRWRHAVTI